jgi:hypothetical protein
MPDSQDQFDLDLPGRLTTALRGAYQHRLEIPARVDDAVVATARQKFHRRRQLKLLSRWGAAVATVAAAILVTIWLLPHRSQNATSPLAKAIKGDIDQSGQLDIVDAMTLAKHLRAGDPTQGTWDINGDTKVDQKDVDALAAAAVSLKQQGLAQQRLPTIDQLGLARLTSPVPSAPRDVALIGVEREDRQ